MKHFHRSRRNLIPAAASILTLLGLTAPTLSRAQVTFAFNYTDAAGIGFNANGQTGADRRAGLAQAASYISSVLGPSYTATIILDVNGSVTNDGTLASAGSNFNSSYPGEGFGTRGDVMTKILGGADPNASAADGQVNWNFEDFEWATGNTIEAGQFDLISTAMHEFTHALGFASGISPDGSSLWGDAPGTATAWTPMDQFIADSTGSLIDGNFVMDGARWDVAKVGGSNNGLFFNGPNARAAFGGNPVPLYSPVIYQPGSSGGSHLDTDFFVGANQQMMNHTGAPPGELDIRFYSGIEIGILRDIGYLNAVPAPSSVAVFALIFSAGSVSLISRKRRKNTAM